MESNNHPKVLIVVLVPLLLMLVLLGLLLKTVANLKKSVANLESKVTQVGDLSTTTATQLYNAMHQEHNQLYTAIMQPK